MTVPSPKNTVVTATAQPNIALIKYWGKADPLRNLPAVGSLSITLAELSTTTRVVVSRDGSDAFRLNGENEPAMAARCFAFIDRLYGSDRPALRIDSRNDFPTAAGLASSASGFAALVVALDALFETGTPRPVLAQQAGAGSGSAARSLFGGFVRLDKPQSDDADIRVTPLLDADQFPLLVLVAITSEHRKHTGSTEAMQLTRDTSPYYPAWLSSHEADMQRASEAIAARDFAALAEVSEHSCLKMHAVMQAARPPLLYWNAATLLCMQRIRELRDEGLEVFFTIDAGPQVKAVCRPECAERVAHELASIDGVSRVLKTALGEGARLVEGGGR